MMHVPSRPFAIASVVAAAVVTSACTVSVGNEHAKLREQHRFSVDSTPDVDLSTFDGPIEVRAWDQSGVRVEVEKRGSSRDAAASIRVEVTQNGNRIRVEATDPAEGRWANSLSNLSRSARLVAEVPRACNLTLTSGDGSVTVERVSGTINLSTKDGAVRGFELDGNLTVETGDGSVKLEHVAGALRVRTGDGPVSLGGRLGHVSVFTGDGPVALKLEPGSRVDEDWDVTTQDGGVVLYVSPDFGAQIDAATGDGTIKIDQGVTLAGQARTKRTLTASLGAGGRVLRIRSGDGGIAIRKF
jgi:DUF4097 and DUF4098 domain-containing protein YvlB